MIDVFHPGQMEIIGTLTLSAVLESLAMIENFSEYSVMIGRRN